MKNEKEKKKSRISRDNSRVFLPAVWTIDSVTDWFETLKT